ncbi:MAG: thiolase domain-containing protein [Thermodesulfobacteriota bacterium]|nr:thiolase domain-containing protein [Thermodesulfobacteriota bacterium]
MREVAVVGVGMTKFGVSNKTQVEMFSEAAMDAISESSIELKDIEALFLGNVLGDFEEGQMNMAPMCAADIGIPNIPATRFEGACASATVAMRNAYMWVASGFYDIVLTGGTEKAMVMGTPMATRTFAMGSDSRYEGFAGITFPGAFGMAAHMYSKKYGIPLEKLKKQMAMVAVKNHKNGMLNPKAQFQKEITVEKVLNGMVIADPLQLLDCCPFSDGAAALIFASADKAKELTRKPVYIVGAGQASAGPLYAQKDFTRIVAREASAKQAYKQAGIRPEDVDLCELHDCFTIAEILAVEALGFFEYGKGSKAAEDGETSLNGRIPINPSGGLKAKGHPIGATGAAQAYEIVKQLREECNERQVKGAKIGMIDTLGGDLATVCNMIFRR